MIVAHAHLANPRETADRKKYNIRLVTGGEGTTNVDYFVYFGRRELQHGLANGFFAHVPWQLATFFFFFFFFFTRRFGFLHKHEHLLTTPC